MGCSIDKGTFLDWLLVQRRPWRWRAALVVSPGPGGPCPAGREQGQAALAARKARADAALTGRPRLLRPSRGSGQPPPGTRVDPAPAGPGDRPGCPLAAATLRGRSLRVCRRGHCQGPA